MGTPALWRPVGREELALIEATGMTAFSPRRPDPTIFHPVTTQVHPVKIAVVCGLAQ